MTVKYNSFSGTCYEYYDILEIKDNPELNCFILKNSEGEIHIPKYEGINLIIDTDKSKLEYREGICNGIFN